MTHAATLQNSTNTRLFPSQRNGGIDLPRDIHLTESDLTLRVDDMVDKAITESDVLTMRRIALFQEADIKVGNGRVSIAFVDDARQIDAMRWLLNEFKDLFVGARLVAKHLNSPPRDLADNACQRAIDRLGVRMTRPIKIQRSSISLFHAEVVIRFEFSGESFALATSRLKAHVRQRARERFWGTTKASASQEVKVRNFLSEVIDKGIKQRLSESSTHATPPSPPLSSQLAISPSPIAPSAAGVELKTACVAEHARGLLPTEPAVNNTHALPEDISESLAKRVELLRRRTGAAEAPLSLSQHGSVSTSLTEAIADGDPLDIAALCVILYDAGLSVRMDRLVRTPFDGNLPVLSRPAVDTPPAVQKPPESPQVPPDSSPRFHESDLLTTEELSARIRYDAGTIRERLKDSVLLKDVHYIRPFGGRKILYKWGPIARDMGLTTPSAGSAEGSLQ